ncbi:autoinducer binding domain-containing protein [Jannaschia seohaensis]|uniref:LuxR family transcriptional regulator n=1 Tax=Jannaschia seohaensis TaxID=475081 RepID=A0A2Y9API9_9RHOB|nr:autoinducer binding domain-containing protein [Jannaschia seohaensis]PWJ19354.1 LuxR family transcriptional regulator [Jannaschia seohaensis]SSA46016.1 LuxR family transcriptional regulator [Jannaschia seohaensis]
MDKATQLIGLFDGLDEMSPSGYAIGLHLSFTTSKYIFQAYPREWMEVYSRKGLILQDPTIRWGVENTGAIRWSDLERSDPGGVINEARLHGLVEGVSISFATDSSRSLASFATPGERFDDATVAELSGRLRKMHEITADIEADSPEDERIRRFAASLSVRGSHGGS